jgi:hypothetical protein
LDPGKTRTPNFMLLGYQSVSVQLPPLLFKRTRPETH